MIPLLFRFVSQLDIVKNSFLLALCTSGHSFLFFFFQKQYWQTFSLGISREDIRSQRQKPFFFHYPTGYIFISSFSASLNFSGIKFDCSFGFGKQIWKNFNNHEYVPLPSTSFSLFSLFLLTFQHNHFFLVFVTNAMIFLAIKLSFEWRTNYWKSWMCELGYEIHACNAAFSLLCCSFFSINCLNLSVWFTIFSEWEYT